MFLLAWWLEHVNRPLLSLAVKGLPAWGPWAGQGQGGFPGASRSPGSRTPAPSPGCCLCTGAESAPPGGERLAWLPKTAGALLSRGSDWVLGISLAASRVSYF